MTYDELKEYCANSEKKPAVFVYTEDKILCGAVAIDVSRFSFLSADDFDFDISEDWSHTLPITIRKK